MIALSELTRARIDGLSRERTAFFFCLGSLEDHGPHLPVGLDLLEAEALAVACADRLEREGWTIVRMPSSALGVDTATSQFALRVRAHVLRDYLIDLCLSLHASGFRHFACFSGSASPRTLTTIEEAGKMLRRKFSFLGRARKNAPTLVSISSIGIDVESLSTNPLFANPPEHGGKRDTSVALAVAPALVDPAYAGLPALTREGSAWERWRRNSTRKLGGYWGDPAAAKAELGAAILSEKADLVIPKLKTVWEGANPNHVFRSWFSIYPPNQSLFKIWLLLLGLMLILAGWIYLAFISMLAGGP